MAKENTQNERHRIDHWLKLCCVYKQRNEATKACDSGHVKINGTRGWMVFFSTHPPLEQRIAALQRATLT